MKSPLKRLAIIIILTSIATFIALPPTIRVVHFDFRKPPIGFHIGSFIFEKNFDLKLGLDLAGGSHIVFETDLSKIAPEDQVAAVDAARDAIDRRINLYGIGESTVQTAKIGNSSRIIVELPGVKDAEEAINLIGKTAQLDFRELVNSEDSTQNAFVPSLSNTKSTGFTGNDFKKARAEFDSQQGRPIISFETKPESSKKFADITTRLVNKPLVIFLDDTLVSAPTVQVPITSGQGVINGQFSIEGAKSLAKLLNAGALPISIKLIEQRTVEASLGQESVNASIVAGIVGLAMVVVFMILYYGRLGFLASLSLFTYAVITLALYKLIPVVLTLPGVAGFILSVGMAVDSNILIFERMKEELSNGKPWLDSMESAFGRAWDSIRDANIATLLTAFILFNPLNLQFLHTSGPVRGFALTLALGIAISLFTGLFVTRTLMRVFARKA